MLTQHGELLVDLFAGGGGASTGIKQATGCTVDIAIDHDVDAIRQHQANHPQTVHYCTDIFAVDPITATQGKPVGLLWASPSCTHFPKANGSKPVSKQTRALAWVVVKWAKAVQPRVICLENVEEFQTWGPLDGKQRPCQHRKGETFLQWVGSLRNLGYQVQWKVLHACDYGVPTIRKRLFLVARRDGLPIQWPVATHGDPKQAQGLMPYRSAAECIDWTLPTPSIFGQRKKPLAENTLRRIARGVVKYVIEAQQPFIVRCAHSEPSAQVAAFLVKYYDGTITSIDHTSMSEHASAPYYAALLVKYYGNERDGVALTEPMHTIPTHDRFGLVTVQICSATNRVTDIGMRMLQPHELYAAQGFPVDYLIAQCAQGKPITKTAQVRLCGNSVCPPMARLLVEANYHAHQDVTRHLDV